MKFLNLFLCFLIAYTPCYGVTGTLGQKSVNSIVQYTLNSPDKAGVIQAYAGSTAPVGWMKAEGQVLEKATYPELFANIGSTWDTFNHPVDGLPTVGGTQFAIPNLKGLYLGGVGNSGVNRTLATFQSDSTAKNGLALSGSVAGGTASLTGAISNGAPAITGAVAGGTASLSGAIAGGSASLTGAIAGGSISDPGHSHPPPSGEDAYITKNATTGGSSLGAAVNINYNKTLTGSSSTGISHVAATNGTLAVSHVAATNGTLAVSNTAANNGTLGVSHAVSNGTLAVSNTAANNGTLAINAGDTETRPMTAPVTYIIKLYDDSASGSVYIQPATPTNDGVMTTTAQSFAGDKTFNDKVGIGTTSPITGLHINGPIAGSDPLGNRGDLVFTTVADTTHPTFAIMNYAHDEISLSFDSYFDSGWKSSDVGTNFRLHKQADALKFQYESGIAVGSPITWTSAMSIDATGKVGVGRVDNAAGNGFLLVVQGMSFQETTHAWDIYNNTGTGTLNLAYDTGDVGNFNKTTGVYTATSDIRKKKNIENISKGIETILALRPVEYNMKTEDDSEVKHLGFIAQEANELVPSSISEFNDGYLGMAKSEIIPILTKAIQEQQAIIEQEKSKNAMMQAWICEQSNAPIALCN